MSKIAPLDDRAILRLSGDDRLSFLQGLITQDIEKLSAQPAIFSALLTPQGKILFDFVMCQADDELLIDCHRDSADTLLKRLTLYKLRAKVAIARDEEARVFALHQAPADTDGVAFQDPRLGALGWRTIGSHASGAVIENYHHHRIGLGVAECGSDFASDEMFLLDVNYDALHGVSYKKGCFVGQEVTSRMKRKGEIRKRTLILAGNTAGLAPGTPVTAGASTLGSVLSAVDRHALALIRLDRLEKAKAGDDAIMADGETLQLALPAYLETV